MASKGERRRITSRIPIDVYMILEARRQDAGVDSLNQYIADLLANYAGRTDLIRELDSKVLPQEVLPEAC
ncbi:MAG: toxin-antitoxin system [Gordonia sp. (in: high G+C Gram-positive bacteria)]|nr:MAG: toxin-antitoxin system [Gordonia sp. (in: high G+C Gram-positive bacteria)]